MVSQWQFEPGVRDGVPSEFKVNVPFQFYAPFDQQVNAVFKRKVFLILPEPALARKEFSGKLKVKKEVKPEFPPSLAGPKIDEKIKVDFVVAPDGTTVNPVFPEKLRPEFIGPAQRAIALTTYAPPLQKGKPVCVQATTTLRFMEEARGTYGRRRPRILSPTCGPRETARTGLAHWTKTTREAGAGEII